MHCLLALRFDQKPFKPAWVSGLVRVSAFFALNVVAASGWHPLRLWGPLPVVKIFLSTLLCWRLMMLLWKSLKRYHHHFLNEEIKAWRHCDFVQLAFS